jgi:hypothetical protein
MNKTTVVLKKAKENGCFLIRSKSFDSTSLKCYVVDGNANDICIRTDEPHFTASGYGFIEITAPKSILDSLGKPVEATFALIQ